MTKHLITALAVLFAISVAAPNIGHAQTFKVEKFDIKGDGGTDYVAAEAGTGRVFVSRATHMMVIEGATGKVLGDIPNTPGVHGAGIRPQGWSASLIPMLSFSSTRPKARDTPAT